MRFLADESCDFAVVRALRQAGHDVRAVSEFQSRSVDSEVIRLAACQSRVLLTEDRDFGWLVFAANLDSAGVILIRYPDEARGTLAQDICKLATAQSTALHGAFTVVRPGIARMQARPGPKNN